MQGTTIRPLLDRTISMIQAEVHEIAKDHGWWDKDCNDGEAIALMHSELSEALEALRNGNPISDKIPCHLNLTEELADCVIRIMDYCEGAELDLEEAILAKMEYNRTRPFMHGGKVF